MEPLIFSATLALLLIHEMDAIQAKEWRMFIFLKNVKVETASKMFVFLHFPLYVCALYALANRGSAGFVLRIVVDVFIVAHTIIHFGFRGHKNNRFRTWFSKAIIYAMPVVAILDLCLVLAL